MTTDTPTDYASLIERLETGSGEDRELDFQLWWIAYGDKVSGAIDMWREIIGDVESTKITDHFTSSLDAALAFAEAVGVEWQFALTEVLARSWEQDIQEFPRKVLSVVLGVLAAKQAEALRAISKDTTDD